MVVSWVLMVWVVLLVLLMVWRIVLEWQAGAQERSKWLRYSE
jgi:hypothetical protein